MTNITLHPDTQTPSNSIFNGNKGLILAIAIALIVTIIGFSAFMALNSGDQYQGLIKKVENQTEKLKKSASPSD